MSAIYFYRPPSNPAAHSRLVVTTTTRASPPHLGNSLLCLDFLLPAFVVIYQREQDVRSRREIYSQANAPPQSGNGAADKPPLCFCVMWLLASSPSVGHTELTAQRLLEPHENERSICTMEVSLSIVLPEPSTLTRT